MTRRIQEPRRLRSPAGVRLLVCAALLVPAGARPEPLRPEHNKTVVVAPGLELPSATEAATCMPSFREDLRHFPDPTLEPLLKAIDEAMQSERKAWMARLLKRSSPEDLLADARKVGGDANGLASLSFFLVSANSLEVGAYTGVRGQRLRRQSDEAIAELTTDPAKHGAWLKQIPTNGARPISLPDWEGLLNDPAALTDVYGKLGFGAKFPPETQRGLAAWRELAGKEPVGEKKNYPGLELQKLGLFNLSVLRERLLAAYEEESEAAFAALEKAPRPENVPEGQVGFPALGPADGGGLTGFPVAFKAAPPMTKEDARERRAFERRWACRGDAPSILTRSASDFVARYSGEASKAVGKVKEKPPGHGLYEKHPRFGLPLAYRRSLLENMRGFDPGALLTEIDTILSAKDEGKFLETAGRTGIGASWLLTTLLNGVAAPMADIWTQVRNALFAKPDALPPIALDKEKRVVAAKEARDRRVETREKAIGHVQSTGKALGRPFAPDEIERFKKLSDDEFDLLVDVLHAAGGIDRSDNSWALLIGDYARKIGGYPARGSSQLLAAIDVSPAGGLRFDPKKLKTFEMFPSKGPESHRSEAADEWLDRANLTIVEHFQSIVEDELDRFRAAKPGRAPRKRADLFAYFDDAFAARYGESMTDRVCGKPPAKEVCDASPNLEDYLALTRFLGMAELALEEGDVIFSAGDRGSKATPQQHLQNVAQENEWAVRRLRDLQRYEDKCTAFADRCGKDKFAKEREDLFRQLYIDADANHRTAEKRVRDLADAKDPKNEKDLKVQAALAKLYEMRLRSLESHLFGHHTPDEAARTQIGFDWPGFLDGKTGDTGATLTLSCYPNGEHTLKGVPAKYVGSTRALVNWVSEKSIDELIDAADLAGSRAAIKTGGVKWAEIDGKLKAALGGKATFDKWNVGCGQAAIDTARLKVAYLLLKRKFAALDSDEASTGFREATTFLESYFGNAWVKNVDYESVPPDIKAIADVLQRLTRENKKAEIDELVGKLKAGTKEEKAQLQKLLVYFQPFYRGHMARSSLYATTVPAHIAEASKAKPELALRTIWENLPIDVQKEEHARAFVGLLRRGETADDLHARLKPIADMEVRRRTDANGGEAPKPPPNPATKADDVLVVHGPFIEESIKRFVKAYVQAGTESERERLKTSFVPPYEYIDEYFAKFGETTNGILSLEQARAFFLWELLKARKIRDGKPLPQAGEHAKSLADLVDPKKPETLRQLIAALEHMVLTIDRKIENRGGAVTNRNLATIPDSMVLNDSLLHLERAWLHLLSDKRLGNPNLEVRKAIYREYGKTWALFRNTLENHGRSRFSHNDDSINTPGVVDTKRISSDTALQGLEDCETFLIIHDASRKHPSFKEALRSYSGGEVTFGGLSLRTRNALENLPPALRHAVNVWCRMDWHPIADGHPEFNWDRFAEKSVPLSPENARLVGDVIMNPYPPTKIINLLVHNDVLRKAYFDNVAMYLIDFDRTLQWTCKDMPPEQMDAARRLAQILGGRKAVGPFKKMIGTKKSVFGLRGVFDNITTMTREERDAFRRWGQEELFALATPNERTAMAKEGGMEGLAQNELKRMHSRELVDYQHDDCARKFDPLKHYLALMVVALDEFGDGGESAPEDEVRLEAVKGGVLRFAPSHVIGLYLEEQKVFGAPAEDTSKPMTSDDVKEMVREIETLQQRADDEMKKLKPGDPVYEGWKNTKYFAFLLDQAFLRVDRVGLREFDADARAHAIKELQGVWTIFSVDMKNKPFAVHGMKELQRLFKRAYHAVGKPDPFEELAPKPKAPVAPKKPEPPPALTDDDRRRTITPEAKKEIDALIAAIGYPEYKSGLLKRFADIDPEKLDDKQRKAWLDELAALEKRLLAETLRDGLGDASDVAFHLHSVVRALRNAISKDKLVVADGRRAVRYFALSGMGEAASSEELGIDAPTTLRGLWLRGDKIPSAEDLKAYREGILKAIDAFEKDPEILRALEIYKIGEDSDPNPLVKELLAWYKAALVYVGDEKTGWLSKDNFAKRRVDFVDAFNKVSKYGVLVDPVIRRIVMYNGERRPPKVQLDSAKVRLADSLLRHEGPLQGLPPLRRGEFLDGDDDAYHAYAKALGLSGDKGTGFYADLDAFDWETMPGDKRDALLAQLDKLDASYAPEFRGRLAMQAPELYRALQKFRADVRQALTQPGRNPKATVLLAQGDLQRAHGNHLADRAKRPKPVAAAPVVPMGPEAPVVAVDPTKGTIADPVRKQVDDLQAKLHTHGKSLTANQRLAVAARDRDTNKLLLELYEPMVHALPKQGVRGTKELWLRLAQSGGPKDILDARQLLTPALDRVQRGDAFDAIAARNLIRRRIREAGVIDGTAVEELTKLADHRFHTQVLPNRLKAMFGGALTSPEAMAAGFDALKTFREQTIRDLKVEIERDLREEVAQEKAKAYRDKLAAALKAKGKEPKAAGDDANAIVDTLFEGLLLTGTEKELPEKSPDGIEYTAEVRALWKKKVALAKEHQEFLLDIRKTLAVDPTKAYRDGFEKAVLEDLAVAERAAAANGVFDDRVGEKRFVRTEGIPRFREAFDAAIAKGLAPHDAYAVARDALTVDPLFKTRSEAIDKAFQLADEGRHGRWDGATGTSARRNVAVAVTGDGAGIKPIAAWCEATADKHWKSWLEAKEAALRKVRTGEGASKWTAFQVKARKSSDALLARQADISRKMGELKQEITRLRRTIEHLEQVQKRPEWRIKAQTPPREREKVLELQGRLSRQLPVLEAEMRAEVAAMNTQNSLIIRQQEELAIERAKLMQGLAKDAVLATNELGTRDERVRNLAAQLLPGERFPEVAVRAHRARSLDRYFELRERANDVGTALAETEKPFAPDDPRVVALAASASADIDGCPVTADQVKTLVKDAHTAAAARVAERKKALDALAEYGVNWNGASIDFSGFKVPAGKKIDGVKLKALFDAVSPLLPHEGGSPVEVAMAQLLRPSPWQLFEADVQGRWAKFGRLKMFEFTKAAGGQEGAAVKVTLQDGLPIYEFTNLAETRAEATKVANELRALARKNPEKMQALQTESNHTLWFLYDPDSKRADMVENVNAIRQKTALLQDYGAIAVRVEDGGGGPAIPLPATMVAFHSELELRHGTYHAIDRMTVELNEDWNWRFYSVGIAVLIIAATIITAGYAGAAAVPAVLSAAATGAGVGLASSIIETDILPAMGFEPAKGSWSERGPELLKTIGVFALGSALGQVFEAGLMASTTAGRSLMTADALAAGTLTTRAGQVATSPLFAHMRGMFYSSMLLDLSLAAKDVADGYDFSLKDFGKITFHAGQTAFYVWGPDQRFASLATSYWARFAMSYTMNSAISFGLNYWNYTEQVDKARNDLKKLEGRKRAEGKDPEKDEEVLEARKQVEKMASSKEFWGTMVRSHLTEAAGHAWFARAAAKHAGHLTLQRDLARLSSPELSKGETMEKLADRVIREEGPDYIDRLNPVSDHNQRKRKGEPEAPLKEVAREKGRDEVDRLIAEATKNPAGPEAAAVLALATKHSGGDPKRFAAEWAEFRKNERNEVIAGLLTQMPQWQIHQLVESKSPEAQKVVELLAAQYGLKGERFRAAWKARVASGDFKRLAPLGGPDAAAHQLVHGNDEIPKRPLSVGERQRQGAALLGAAERAIDAELAPGPQWARREELMGELLTIRPDRVKEYRFDLLTDYVKRNRNVAIGDGAQIALALAAKNLGVNGPEGLLVLMASTRMPKRFGYEEVGQLVQDVNGGNPARQVEILEKRQIAPEVLLKYFGEPVFKEAARRLYTHRNIGKEADFDTFYTALGLSMAAGKPAMKYFEERTP